MALKRPKKKVNKDVASPVKKKSPGRHKPVEDNDDEGMTDKELLALVPGALSASFVKAKLHEKQLQLAGLSAPSDWDGDMPELPNDIAAEDHDSLSNLMAEFVNALSTATWHQSMAYIEHNAYDQIADYLFDLAIQDAEGSNDQKRSAEARSDESVVAARSLANEAYRNYVRFRDLASTLKLKHATVSRVGGFVGDEVDAGDKLGSRSTRGASGGSSKGSSKGSTKRLSRK